jgi:hypothetical protein
MELTRNEKLAMAPFGHDYAGCTDAATATIVHGNQMLEAGRELSGVEVSTIRKALGTIRLSARRDAGADLTSDPQAVEARLSVMGLSNPEAPIITTRQVGLTEDKQSAMESYGLSYADCSHAPQARLVEYNRRVAKGEQLSQDECVLALEAIHSCAKRERDNIAPPNTVRL